MERKASNAVCFYCLKTVVDKEVNVQSSKKNHKRISMYFRKLVSQTSAMDITDPHKWLNRNGVLLKESNMVCVDCQFILKIHSKFYQEFQSLQQKLNGELKQLCNIMQSARKVPSRIEQAKIEWKDDEDYETLRTMRKIVIKKCSLKNRLKRVTFQSDHQSNPEPESNETFKETESDKGRSPPVTVTPTNEQADAGVGIIAATDNEGPCVMSAYSSAENAVMEIDVTEVCQVNTVKKEDTPSEGEDCHTEGSIDVDINSPERTIGPSHDEHQFKEKRVQQNNRKLRQVFRCDTCHRTFASSTSLQNHKEGLYGKHCTDWRSSKKMEKMDVGSTFHHTQTQGGICSPRNIQVNINDQRCTVLQCNFCPRAFINEHFLLEHVKTKHNREGSIVRLPSGTNETNDAAGENCEKASDTVLLTEDDKFKHGHTDQKYRWQFYCEVCGKMCQHKSNLKRHAISHTKEKPFACDFCAKGFSLKYSLKRHVKLVHHTIQEKGTI